MIIIALIVAVLYPFVIKLMEMNDIQLLNETTDAKIAIEIRKKLKRNRIIILVLMLILYAIFEIVTTIVITNFEDPQNIADLIRNIGLTGVAMYIYLRKQNGVVNAVGNISTASKHNFLEQHKKYCLFLRGFEQDDYGHDPVVSEKTYDSFSEYEFTSLVMQNIPICAVGMTKEVNSPRGATRVYLNDDSWQNDVLELMEKSQVIYILVNDRKSCIWEIEQSFKMLGKTVYIIDDIQKYENVRQQFTHKISFPKVPDDQKSDKNIFVMTYLNEDFDIKSYKNNIEGYSLALGIESEDLKKKKKLKKRRKILWIIMGIIYTPIVFLVIACVVINIRENINDENNVKPYNHNIPINLYETNINNVIEIINVNCPLKVDESLTLINIEKEKSYLRYNYSINENYVSFEEFTLLLKRLKEESLKSIAVELKTLLVNCRYGIIYYYKGNISGDECFFTIEYEDILKSSFEISDERINEVKEIYEREFLND